MTQSRALRVSNYSRDIQASLLSACTRASVTEIAVPPVSSGINDVTSVQENDSSFLGLCLSDSWVAEEATSAKSLIATCHLTIEWILLFWLTIDHNREIRYPIQWKQFPFLFFIALNSGKWSSYQMCREWSWRKVRNFMTLEDSIFEMSRSPHWACKRKFLQLYINILYIYYN